MCPGSEFESFKRDFGPCLSFPTVKPGLSLTGEPPRTAEQLHTHSPQTGKGVMSGSHPRVQGRRPQ